jgi:uncharacterized protein (DUF983 family)
MTHTDQDYKTAVKRGVKCKCPKCGKGKLFADYLKIAPNCEACGLDYSFADPADGPAFFAMSLMMLLSVIFALWLEAAFAPPFWVHLLTTFPLVVGGSLGVLQPIKGWLFAAEYHHMQRLKEKQ